MAKSIRTDPKPFRELNSAASLHEAKGRTLSAALLLWFLENIFRLDDTESQDAICDNTGDEGIDALLVNDDDNRITLFQSKRREKLPATLGATDLRKFVGTLTAFGHKSAVSRILTHTPNTDLRRLLQENNVADKVGRGYQVRGVFVTNVNADANARRYLGGLGSTGTQIELWDLAKISPVLRQLSREWFVNESVSLAINPAKLFYEGPQSSPSLAFAAIRAKELIAIPGIDDTRVFAQNVRLSLGRTRVNRDIEATIGDKHEHGRFLAFHNGLTIVARDIELSDTSLQLNRYSICNGCQSLRAFFTNAKRLTNDLEVLVRVVRVSEDRSLADSIAYRTNNQNPINLRDLSSNDPTQIHLKQEFDSLFGWSVRYGVKRGEENPKNELSNEFAGQLILSLYERSPWSAHQKYKVFGELRSRIFRHGRNAAHIRLSQLLYEIIESSIGGIANERVRKYTLTKHILLFLAGEILRQSQDGKRLLEDPLPYLHLKKTRGSDKRQEAVLEQVKNIVHLCMMELDFYVEDAGEAYDYKSAFKSEAEVKKIRAEVLKAHEKDIRRGRAPVLRLPNRRNG